MKAEPYIWIGVYAFVAVINAERGNTALTILFGTLGLVWAWIAFMHIRRGGG